MKEFKFRVKFHGVAWVTVEADTKKNAIDNLINGSCSLEDYATVDNMLNFHIEIEKGDS